MSAADHTAALIDRVHYDDAFQHACQRYAHNGGSSMAVARAALHAVGVGGDAVLLPVPDGLFESAHYFDSGDAIWIRDIDECGECFDRFFSEADCFASNRDGWHPAIWFQCLYRRDTHGRLWRTTGPLVPHVMDDYGYLVPVGGAA